MLIAETCRNRLSSLLLAMMLSLKSCTHAKKRQGFALHLTAIGTGHTTQSGFHQQQAATLTDESSSITAQGLHAHNQILIKQIESAKNGPNNRHFVFLLFITSSVSWQQVLSAESQLALQQHLALLFGTSTTLGLRTANTYMTIPPTNQTVPMLIPAFFTACICKS
jgi:hypothetical protein